MWNFIVANGPLFTMFGVVVVVLVVGFVLVPLMKRKGMVKQEDVQLTGQLLEIVSLILSDVRFQNEKTKQETATVIQIAHTATLFVGEMMADATDDEKRDYAVKAASTALVQMNVEVTDARKKLIELTVNASLPMIAHIVTPVVPAPTTPPEVPTQTPEQGAK